MFLESEDRTVARYSVLRELEFEKMKLQEDISKYSGELEKYKRNETMTSLKKQRICKA